MKNAGKGGMGGLLFKKHTRSPNLWTPQERPMQGFHAYPTRTSQHLFTAGRQFAFTASISGGAVDWKKEMLRKKYHVVRKKNHVVRKLFYVASIFDGALTS